MHFIVFNLCLYISVLIKSTQKGPASIGSVLSRIILANVPVSNGVIHFINSPLGLITQSVVSYIQVMN